MSDIVFMDTEATGLLPGDEVWEFASVRRNENGVETKLHMFIEHDGTKAQFLPTSFYEDYKKRCPKERVLSVIAAHKIQIFTMGAHIVGAVPNFDTELLAKLLRSHKLEPKWHYHLIDVENIIVGYLAGKGELMKPPWKSDDLSRAVGVNPDDFERHTAMGDVKWIMAQWDAVFGGA